jgi:endoglucanase Acf2
MGIVFMQKNLMDRKIVEPETQKNNTSEVINNFSTQTIFSNQWYSSIYKTFPSQQMFAFPLAYKLTEEGVGFSLPKVTRTPNTIYGSFIEDFSVGLEEKLNKPVVEKIGNWSVGLRMNDAKKKSISFTLAHGLPSTTITTTDQKIIVRLKDAATLYDNGKTKIEDTQILTTDAIRVDIHGNSYIIALPKKSSMQIFDKKLVINSHKIFIGALDTPEHFSLFKQNSQFEIMDTVVVWRTTDDVLETYYKFIGNDKTPLIALLPHQYESLKEKKEFLGSYDTLRGKMQLVKGDSFTTVSPLIVPAESFESLKDNHSDFISALKEDQKKILSDNQPDNGDYFLGAWYGKAANILLLLDSAGLQQEKQQLISYLESKLLRSLTYLKYQKEKQSVIADKPEFGNENLNDHHFHYGYFIRTAAVLSRLDPTFKPKVEKPVNILIKDIASTDRTAAQFSFLRNFDIYEGHSWADGFANFGDGNNQESSSEAIGAWYSVYLWAKATGDKNLEQTALYLYNTEIQSTLYYWFGKNKVFTKPYNHEIASIVWGGKLDYSTWFSDKTNMKYGIQILPVTPGSFGYLGKLENFSKYENNYYTTKGDISDEWGDLFVMLTSFYDPYKALALKDKVKKYEANNPKSLFLYTLYHNKELR